MKFNIDSLTDITEEQRLAIRQIMNGKIDFNAVSDLSPDVRKKIEDILKHVERQPKPVSPQSVELVRQGLMERKKRGK